MDFNLLGDAAWAAKRCCLEMATGYARGGHLRVLRAELRRRASRGRLRRLVASASVACCQAA
jgi:hypothetical protein